MILSFLAWPLALSLTSLIIKVNAQVQVEGKYRLLSLQKGVLQQPVVIHVLPEQNNTQLAEDEDERDRNIEMLVPLRTQSTEEDQPQPEVVESIGELNQEQPIEVIDIPLENIKKYRPYVFGTKVPVTINMNESGSGEWTEDLEAGTRHWRTVINSKDAVSISLNFYDFYLASGSELYILTDQEQLGAFTPEINNKPERIFSTAPLSGEYIVIEYIEPIETVPGTSSLIIGHVVHGFRQNGFTGGKAHIGLSGSCNINVACLNGKDGWEDEINSVGMLVMNGGTSTCTGTMLNNVKKNGRQLFLTAFHCVDESTDVTLKNDIVIFNFQSPTCKRKEGDKKPKSDTVHGLRLLTYSRFSDYALLQVVEEIPDTYNVFLAGWNRTYDTTSGLFVGFHHPKSDLKKVSGYFGPLRPTRIAEVSRLANFWEVSKWDKGVTETGSSGSGLFNNQGQLIGHLFGGQSACNKFEGSDYYGALGRDFRQTRSIQLFLDPEKTEQPAIKGEYLKNLRASSGFNFRFQSANRVIEWQFPIETRTKPTERTITVGRYTPAATGPLSFMDDNEYCKDIQ